ncbi:cell wall hydrolase [Sphingomonas echinoides]|uniref:cell wall hydrolase n=1 Tax=Sphingomonas echinoides TaxID=59803 RepID=UPI0024133C43|nr:cell wall hydrolase [Sphingomonas echinoides]
MAPARLSIVFVGAGITCLLGVTLALVYLAIADRPDVLAIGDLPVQTRSSGPADAPASPDDLPLETYLPQQKRALDTMQAFAENYARPLTRINPLPPPFDARWLSKPDRAAASTCLATALYYEADGEPPSGQRAVAQVVLNRLRNPHYPKTVCGVVYQGADRPTGCQFTFACDGSLVRRPAAAGMARARAIADAALNGGVSPTAGQATHYHTVWIVPRWAGELLKVAIVGHHVFYRPPRPYGGYDVASTPSEQPLPSPSTATALPDAPPLPPIPVGASADRDPAASTPIASPVPAPVPTSLTLAIGPPGSAANVPPSPQPARTPPTVYFPTTRRTKPSLAIPAQ